MAIDHVPFIEYAQHALLEDTEFSARNSASRAYYAALHAASVCLKYCPDNSNLRYGTHERVTTRYESFKSSHPLHAAGKGISYTLKQLKQVRVKADYKLDANFSKAEAEAQLSLAKIAMERVLSFKQLAESQAA